MTGAEDAPLMDIGQHCSLADCHQIDFLPFTCDCCSRVYCLEHRTYQAHSCPKAGQKESTTIICPLCAKAVKLVPGQDPNIVFEQHTRTGCDPQNYEKVHKKRQCPVVGCKQKLTTVNTYTCKECSVQVCLKHRFPADHTCQSRAAPARIQGVFGQGLGSWWKGVAASASSQGRLEEPKLASKPKAAPQKATRPAPVASAALPQANTVQGSAHRRAPPAQSNAGPSRSSNAAQEFCPECGMGFNNIMELIQHSEHQHQAGPASHGFGQDMCPHCHQAFDDPVTLVAHVQRVHPTGASNQTTCVLC